MKDSVQPLGPGSVAWRICGDRRSILLGGYALLLQVSHPAVGAGVEQHSEFLANPWERLNRTINSELTLIFGGQKAIDEAIRLRNMHATIKGVDDQGRRYHALNPSAYAWVHLTLYQTFVATEQWFSQPLSEADQQKLYAEWRQLGLILGLRDHCLPRDLSDFRSYFDEMVRTQLENNQTVQDVVKSLRMQDVPPPSWWFLPQNVWKLIKPLGIATGYTSSIGALPSELRDRFGLQWTDREAQRLQSLARLVKRLMPLLPKLLRWYPIALRAEKAQAG